MKKQKQLWTALLLTLCLLLVLSACNNQTDTSVPTDVPTETPIQTPTQTPTEEPTITTEAVVTTKEQEMNNTKHLLSELAQQVKHVGRTQVKTNGIACDFTASGIEFEATVTGDMYLTVNSAKDNYFTLFIDGVRQENRLYAPNGVTKIKLCSFAKAETHTFRILKQTEAQNGISILQQLDFEGSINGPAANRDLYIEFLGDSITCGHGSLLNTKDAPNGDNAGSALYSDGTNTYAFLAAEMMNADASMISWSGIGVCRGYSNIVMKQLYEAASYPRSASEKFDFANARVPDIVVVNLGTNDNTFATPKEELKAGVKELVGIIRQNYGEDTIVLWCHGMMETTRGPQIKEALDEMGGEADGLYTVGLTYNRNGGNGHPSASGHEDASVLLWIKLNAILKK